MPFQGPDTDVCYNNSLFLVPKSQAWEGHLGNPEWKSSLPHNGALLSSDDSPHERPMHVSLPQTVLNSTDKIWQPVILLGHFLCPSLSQAGKFNVLVWVITFSGFEPLLRYPKLPWLHLSDPQVLLAMYCQLYTEQVLVTDKSSIISWSVLTFLYAVLSFCLYTVLLLLPCLPFSAKISALTMVLPRILKNLPSPKELALP